MDDSGNLGAGSATDRALDRARVRFFFALELNELDPRRAEILVREARLAAVRQGGRD